MMEFAKPRSVTLVDDDRDFRRALAERLRLEGYLTEDFASAATALDGLSSTYPGVVVTDLRMPGLDGRQFLTRLRALDEDLPVIMITGHGDVAEAVATLREGAYDFVAKPFAFDRLADSLERALEKRGLVLDNRALTAAMAHNDATTSLLGASAAIVRLRAAIQQIADSGMDVLIEGETGVGKEVVARALHAGGRRRVHSFVAVNCAALPEAMVESELFGHEVAAFPGATRKRIGLIEQSHRGTLFLDEIESMPMSAQAKLLRVLEEREVQPLGASGPRQLDLRVLAASKIDLADAAAKGVFRSDLYYRLNVVKLQVPPLRERRGDIPLLFAHFLQRAGRQHGLAAPSVSLATRRRLEDYHWPGNVRELAHFADRLCLGVDMDDAQAEPIDEGGLAEQVNRFERAVIESALKRHLGDVSVVAAALRTPRKTLYDKFRRLRIDPSAFRAPRES